MDAASSRNLLLDKVKQLPGVPGCYLFKNDRDEIIYIGKAKNLQKRVQSYFHQGAKTAKTEVLVSKICELDFILASNEAEAFVLESNLIKKHRPKYNIRLKDGKTYPYIVVDFNEEFPRIEFQRRPKRKQKRKIFGPFTHGVPVWDAIKTLSKVYELRDCSLHEFRQRKTPCLLYQMKQCGACCVGLDSKEDYLKRLKLATSFFENKGDKVLKNITGKMQSLANDEKFEQAAFVRDQIKVLQDFNEQGQQKNAELTAGEPNLDIVSFYRGEIEVAMCLYIIRNSILIGHQLFYFSAKEEGDDSLWANLLFQYYKNNDVNLPRKIVHSLGRDEEAVFSKALELEFLQDAPKTLPVSKKHLSIYQMCLNTAQEHLKLRSIGDESEGQGLEGLQKLLGLKERPRVLECYDIAIFAGSSPTAAQIVFHEGSPEKSRYRHYHLEERPEGNNDFAMMKEVFSRRAKHDYLPDVMIVDGGKGQVSSALEALKEAGLEIPVVGLAKEKVRSKAFNKEQTKTEERLIIPGRSNPYILKKNKGLFKILTSMRDEAHRFSRRLHHKAEKKRVLGTWPGSVHGIGPQTANDMRKRLEHSWDEVMSWNVDVIGDYFDVSLEVSQALKKAWKTQV